MNSGQKGTIQAIDGGERAHARLLDIGFYEGETITIIENSFNGPIIVRLGSASNKIALGMGLAQKIMVLPA
jgi:Fe2+ transport system protein FeoA